MIPMEIILSQEVYTLSIHLWLDNNYVSFTYYLKYFAPESFPDYLNQVTCPCNVLS